MIEPLGLGRFLLGGDEAAEADVAELVLVGETPTAAEIEATFGIPDIDLGEVTPEILLHFNDPEIRRVGIPAAGGISDAATLAVFYQHLLRQHRGHVEPVGAGRRSCPGAVRPT